MTYEFVLQILDMLKDTLECEKESSDTLLPSALCNSIYTLIHAAVADNDVENSLHMAQYLDFFQAHISKKVLMIHLLLYLYFVNHQIFFHIISEHHKPIQTYFVWFYSTDSVK